MFKGRLGVKVKERQRKDFQRELKCVRGKKNGVENGGRGTGLRYGRSFSVGRR